MPGIYVLKCDQCDFNIGPHVMSITLVIKDDGTEVLCPHPCERMIAEAATGKGWGDLIRQGRVRYRFGLVCLACGNFAYYGPDHDSKPAAGWTHIGNIVHHTSSTEAGNYTCDSCGKKALYPVCGDTGCLLALLKVIGFYHHKKVACPKCKNGTLSSEMVAIS